MTVPAVTAPVLLAVSEQLLLDMLRLPGGTRLAGAEVQHWPAPRLVLHLEMTGVPEGADEVEPQYERDAVPDPVRLSELRWLRGGNQIAVTLPADD